MTKEELVAFEDKIANYFNHGRIRSPVHLSFDNESELIKIFRNISDKDWILCSWRSHYHCLLKGVPMDRLERDILDGKSI